MTTSIRTGIIGYGLSGRVFHAPFIDVVDGYELTKISTRKPESVSLINRRYPSTVVVPDGQDIIDDPAIDLVIVTSPNTDHFRWAKAAFLREACRGGEALYRERCRGRRTDRAGEEKGKVLRLSQPSIHQRYQNGTETARQRIAGRGARL